MAAIGTWAFSEPAVERIRSLVSAGLHATDVVERAVAEVEDDGETGRFVVGRGGFPTSAGVLECDAAIMEGVAGRFGGVASLRGVGTPIRVARRVMDRSPHSLLVGEGAAAFAQDQGFPLEPNESLLTPSAVAAYQEFLEKQRRVPGHDTLGVSSSGVPFKSPGRVGDSPLPGCGLYADDTAGAAAATGDGDKIMCFCPSFHTVQLMKQGLPPTEACEAVLRDVARRTAPDEVFELGLVAMNMKVHTMGEAGAAATMEFPYTFWNSGKDSVQKCVQEPVAGLNIL
ncbi:N(4)-(beta-N-acetylglucosaminyl)-L-asparaginase isoform X3 [Scleropages formosus]|uniref:N(4)-(beta-N-acetylglucosaminyl)-L-asparaginase isoform X3 n=1 Tax=Scleropages formosus TaxID=113540 RepID=UPI0010FA88A3|nr:N(4)-(beta-N-acetylglucosaminyl)-L-asparaginase-like isoform X3 [Scleropages formosus]